MSFEHGGSLKASAQVVGFSIFSIKTEIERSFHWLNEFNGWVNTSYL